MVLPPVSSLFYFSLFVPPCLFSFLSPFLSCLAPVVARVVVFPECFVRGWLLTRVLIHLTCGDSVGSTALSCARAVVSSTPVQPTLSPSVVLFLPCGGRATAVVTRVVVCVLVLYLVNNLLTCLPLTWLGDSVASTVLLCARLASSSPASLVAACLVWFLFHSRNHPLISKYIINHWGRTSPNI